MSAKHAHGVDLATIVAANVRKWRLERGLDQQGLADRLGALGWPADRTTITRIESVGERSRKVTVNDLGVLSVALNVPLPVLLLPDRDAAVQLTPSRSTSTLHPWLLWEWMRGEEPLPGRVGEFGSEWRRGAQSLWMYERVRAAQLRCQRVRPMGGSEPAFVGALQELLDAAKDMELAGLPSAGLIAKQFAEDINTLGLRPTPPAFGHHDDEDLSRGSL